MHPKANRRKGKGNIKCKDETDISSIDEYRETSTILNKKAKAESSLPSPNNLSEIGKQCDICLEYDKYTLTKCIKCAVCNSYCHFKCYQEHFDQCDTNESSLSCFICARCTDSQTEGCIICNEYNGIVKKRNKANDYIHLHCVIFIKELIEENQMKNDHHYTKAISPRKWRKKSQCKLCKERLNEDADKAVIKCTKSKCQRYYHIPCANKLSLLYPIDFQYDFYGVTKANRGMVCIPFYCAYHNKRIVSEYNDFITQMETLLKETQPKDKESLDLFKLNSQVSLNDDDCFNTNALSIDFNPWVNSDVHENGDYNGDNNDYYNEYTEWNLRE